MAGQAGKKGISDGLTTHRGTRRLEIAVSRARHRAGGTDSTSGSYRYWYPVGHVRAERITYRRLLGYSSLRSSELCPIRVTPEGGRATGGCATCGVPEAQPLSGKV